jgi:Polyketide synthase modules and related proteins
LPDLAYTLSERRTRHFHRACAVSRSTQIDYHSLEYGKPRAKPLRVGYIFTGQGAQWPRMGKMLIDVFPSCKQLIQKLDQALQELSHPPQWSLLGITLQNP